jgi:hypothetical protein
MKSQYEQTCNAAALARMGVPVVKNLRDKHLATLDHWLQNGGPSTPTAYTRAGFGSDFRWGAATAAY